MTHAVFAQRAAVASLTFAAFAAVSPVAAADLPEIRISTKNTVAACVTPGRLMAYLKARTPGLDSRFDTVGVEYMRHGERLGMRWDYAFFQMIVETGGLTFKNGNRSGDVKPSQFNLAGLGATGNGETGETFPDLATGVQAHLQHVLMYSGAPVDKPVAERTRKVQEWGVLTSWQKGFKRPITFADLASKWAPKSKSYSDGIESVADKFFDETCKKADPQPELVAEARGEAAKPVERIAEATPEKPADKPSGADLARKAIEDGKAEEQNTRSGLVTAPATKAGDMIVKLLNGEKTDAEQPQKIAALAPPATKSVPVDKPVAQVAAAAGAAKTAVAAPAAGQKCRVWTASYGGQKSVIVRSIIDGVINFTVLDVNDGQETREADAFISAYAKGGTVAGEFAAQGPALDKAFELCPEG